MQQYLDLLRYILKNGVKKGDRTGIGTISTFGYQMRFDLSKGFPLLTTKKVFIRGIIHELIWFLKGDTNIKYLVDNDVHIWDDWPYAVYKESKEYKGETMQEFIEKIKNNNEFANKWGDLGPVYGKQWRKWSTPDGREIDQIAIAINTIKRYPNSRRILVSGWNVSDIMGLIKGKRSAPPLCHSLFQFYVVNGKLSCQLYQRSADVFLGVPFNIASYSLLTMMIAQVCNLKPGEFIHTFGDVHIYLNHLEQVNLQLSRKPRKLPIMKINPKVNDINHFKYEDFKLEGYDPHPPIKAPIAV